MQNIRKIFPPENGLAICHLGQAGFSIKNHEGTLVVIDAYLSDAVEREFGFKRMTPAVVTPNELEADYWLSTHSHLDHLDTDALPIVATCEKTFFVGAPDCEEIYRKFGIPANRYAIIPENGQKIFPGLTVRGVFADHGELAPDALGLLMDFDGIKVFHTGDTCFAPEKIKASLNTAIDVLIAPINGQFGNMTAREAVELANILKPKRVIAAHFWMFLEHVGEKGTGDPATFLLEADKILGKTEILPVVLSPGEIFLYERE